MSLNGTVWLPLGASPLVQAPPQIDWNGLVTAIAVNPNNPSIIYLGTSVGGVWRSGDGGATWAPMFDKQASLGIGEPGGIAIDPNDTSTIYAGTSSRKATSTASAEATLQPPAGLFKSKDGGASWIRLGSGYPAENIGNAGQFVGQHLNVVIVDPADSRVVYLASSSGVFRSTDGGHNWGSAAANSSGDARSLALDLTSPASARILYAGITGRGVFRSNDGGRTFAPTPVLGATTPAVATAAGTFGFGHVVVALAPPATPPSVDGVQVLYAALAGNSGGPDPVGLFSSIDQGRTWRHRNLGSGTQNGYCMALAVDPASRGDGERDILYWGGNSQFRSDDSGAHFKPLSVGTPPKNAMHGDTHVWAIIPGKSNSIVFCGNDGGIATSTNDGQTWTSLNGGGLQTGLFRNIDFDLKPSGTIVTVGALQDNGVATTAAASPSPRLSLPWPWCPAGGDGWDVAYDASVPPVLYATVHREIYGSTNDGTDLTNVSPPAFPVTGETGAGQYLAADPVNPGIVYLTGNEHLWQTRNGGGLQPGSTPPGEWRIIFSGIHRTGNVDVARGDGHCVVLATGTQVHVSTNALASMVTFRDITRNLPGRNVSRACFDPVDPTVIYAVLTGLDGGTPGQNGHVFRTTLGASSWTDISPPLDYPCGAIALDGTTTPTSLYVGTDLGVIFSVDGGASWSILDDIHFPRVPVFDLVFKAGVLRAATFGRGVFDFGKPTGPAISVSLQDGLAFGTICKGPRYLTLDVNNVGAQDLVITSVQRLMGSTDFSVLSTPATPLVIRPGDQMSFTVRYVPTTTGKLETATIRILSNDPTAPFVDLMATGTKGTPRLATVIAGNGDLGNVCVGSFADGVLTLANGGACPLEVRGITSSSPEFSAPRVRSYPLIVGPGESLDVAIRFQPTTLGSKSATITVDSDDPGGPHEVTVSGTAPAAKLAVTGSTTFGGVPFRRQAQRTVSICNVGACELHVASVAFKHKRRDFRLLQNPFPATVRPGSSLDVVIRYWASGGPPRPCELVITSNDPTTPVRTLEVTAWTHRDHDAKCDKCDKDPCAQDPCDDDEEHGDEDCGDET